MRIAQLKTVVSKADADRIFSMARSEWEAYAKGLVHPEGWEVRLDLSDEELAFLRTIPLLGLH